MLSYSEWMTLLGLISSSLVIIVTAVWSFAWFMAKQFSATRRLIDEKIEKLEESIVKKLEYHERHDDSRFNSLNNEIWQIRIRNAARDGLPPPIDKKR